MINSAAERLRWALDRGLGRPHYSGLGHPVQHTAAGCLALQARDRLIVAVIRELAGRCWLTTPVDLMNEGT